jgi:hypothetical protein
LAVVRLIASPNFIGALDIALNQVSQTGSSVDRFTSRTMSVDL